MPDQDDLEDLQKIIADHDPALAVAEERLRELGIHCGSRLKTHSTLIDKLRREKSRLSSVHDIAGLRIVKDMSLAEQDDLVKLIVGVFAGSRRIDRRAEPSHGYRAVHVIAKVEECFVEIQVRTGLQDIWAQVMETLGDIVGRGVRYGEPPPAVAEVVEMLQETSQEIADLEAGRDSLDRLESSLAVPSRSPSDDEGPTDDELAEIEAALQEVDRLKETMKSSEENLRGSLQRVLSILENIRKGTGP